MVLIAPAPGVNEISSRQAPTNVHHSDTCTAQPMSSALSIPSARPA